MFLPPYHPQPVPTFAIFCDAVELAHENKMPLNAVLDALVIAETAKLVGHA
jgi:hypothetical protein